MLATPSEAEERRLSPSGSSVNALSPNAPATTSPFAFRLALPPQSHGAGPSRYPADYETRHSYDRTYTPPYTSKGLSHQPVGYFDRPAAERPALERSVSMRREAPAFGGLDQQRRRPSMERTLPSLPPLDIPNSTATASSSLPSPRKESCASDENSITSSKEKSPPLDLKLPPITSIGLPDHLSWSSTLRTRRP